MPAFEYSALDLAGRTRQGVITAADERAARSALEKRRLAPVRVAPSAGAEGRASTFGGDRLGARDLALVTRQLATMIAVAPLEEALRTIAAQSEKAKVRRVLMRTHAGVLEGFRLADAMGRQGRGFPPLYRAMVAAGESSGALPQILERLADDLEREQQVRGKVLTAVVYPIMLAIVALVVIVALMTFVVPKVVDQFDSMGQRLPLLTQVVIAISEVMRSFGWIALLAALAGSLAFGHGLRRPGFKLKVDRFVLGLPVIGRLVRDLEAARLARMLSTMIASGLPVLEGLTIAGRTIPNQVIRGAVERMATSIREGGSLSAAMRRVDAFPPILVYMAASGENSGRLETMLGRAAEYLEREFNTFTQVALSLLEPAIIVFMGGMVALIVLSILLPILQINTLALG